MTQFLVLVLLLLCAGLLVAAYRGHKSKEEEEKREGDGSDMRNLSTPSIADAKHGDAVTVIGASEDFDDLHFTVDRVSTYRRGEERWGEISGVAKNRRIFVEWHDDDEITLLLRRADDLKLADLGIGDENLARFDEEESRDNHIVYDGDRYDYSFSGEVLYSRDGAEEEGFYAWDFEGQGAMVVWVEKWAGEPFVVGVSERILPHNVTILRK
ncbi:MAG: hypothetical protein CME06_14530 [Gemmatimonadetes bacterium]|nr:hypothetical protein [Gemmatimonadota bacterium]